jgi:D-alanine transaminase
VTVYLNGEWLPREAAKISVFDRGFLFADGVYEVIPVYAGKPVYLDAHLQRLGRSLAAIKLENPLEETEWLRVIEELIAENRAGDLSIYIQISRGVASTPRDHAFSDECVSTVLISTNPIKPLIKDPDKAAIKAVLKDDIRWGRCDIKSVSLLGNVMLRQAAVAEGAQEALLIRDGWVTEGAASNLFMVRDSEVMTPPEGPEILSGITRASVLSLLRGEGIKVREAPISTVMLKQADEVWVSSSTKGVVPVTQVDGLPIGNGKPGPIWQRIQHLYIVAVLG